VGIDKYRRLTEGASSALLSTLLPELLVFAQDVRNSEVTRWATLELGGYLSGNSALTNDIVVPEYRTVVGQYSDRSGRPLVVTDSRLAFINEYRLRHSVAELELMEQHSGLLAIEDPTFTEMISDKLGVVVYQFCFSPSCVAGVLSGIRARLIQWLGEMKPNDDHLTILKTEPVPYPGTRWMHRMFARKGRRLDGFHPIVVATASRLYGDGHYRQAVLDTYIALVQRVKEICDSPAKVKRALPNKRRVEARMCGYDAKESPCQNPCPSCGSDIEWHQCMRSMITAPRSLPTIESKLPEPSHQESDYPLRLYRAGPHSLAWLPPQAQVLAPHIGPPPLGRFDSIRTAEVPDYPRPRNPKPPTPGASFARRSLPTRRPQRAGSLDRLP
jgi:hypothetical protein